MTPRASRKPVFRVRRYACAKAGSLRPPRRMTSFAVTIAISAYKFEGDERSFRYKSHIFGRRPNRPTFEAVGSTRPTARAPSLLGLGVAEPVVRDAAGPIITPIITMAIVTNNGH